MKTTHLIECPLETCDYELDVTLSADTYGLNPEIAHRMAHQWIGS